MKHKTILLLASLFVVGIACKQFDREFSVNTNIDYCEAQALRTLAIVPSGSEGGIPNSIDGDDVNWPFHQSRFMDFRFLAWYSLVFI